MAPTKNLKENKPMETQAFSAMNITPGVIALCQTALSMIRNAAERGEKCPSNQEIGERVGYQSKGAVAMLFRYLIRANLINVHIQPGVWRQVEACDKSWRTAPRPAPGERLRAPRRASGVRPTPSPEMKAQYFRPRRAKYPPPTREEVARLVAEFVASRSVTVCPAAAKQLASSNVGMEWR